ncbi:MAG TPA: hypothetical protein VJ376_07705 [Pseudomonadota bacterium]|nr:hypothetical protein [Pseudomonadota bacterium]
MTITAKQQHFINVWMPQAMVAGAALSIAPPVLIAQWALETGWQGPRWQPGGEWQYNMGNLTFGGVIAHYATPADFTKEFVQIMRSNFPAACGTGANVHAFVHGLLHGRLGKYFTADPVAYEEAVTEIAHSAAPA